MSRLPKREKLDPVQASAVDFVVAQEGNFYIKGEAATGKSVVLAHVAAELALSVVSTEAQPSLRSQWLQW